MRNSATGRDRRKQVNTWKEVSQESRCEGTERSYSGENQGRRRKRKIPLMESKWVTGSLIGGPGEGDGGKAERETAGKTMGVKEIWEQPPAQGSPKGWGSCQEADGGTGHEVTAEASEAHGQASTGMAHPQRASSWCGRRGPRPA